jgi:hypothetical protein
MHFHGSAGRRLSGLTEEGLPAFATSAPPLPTRVLVSAYHASRRRARFAARPSGGHSIPAVPGRTGDDRIGWCAPDKHRVHRPPAD